MRFLQRFPDWLLYGGLLVFILLNAMSKSEHKKAPSPPPELGEALPNVRPSDPRVLVDVGFKASSGVGTAFAVDNKGTWLTAKHVVDGCDEIGLRLSGNNFVRVKVVTISKNTDTAILTSKWNRPALAQDFDSQRRLGEHGFFLGFPQGAPGEAAGRLVGRRRMIVKGRYRSQEPVLAWTEIGRTRGLKGSLGGLSGGPVFDADGEVIGLVTAESARRGRIYTVSPASLDIVLPSFENEPNPDTISMKNYGRRADKYRRSRRIAQVACLVE